MYIADDPAKNGNKRTRTTDRAGFCDQSERFQTMRIYHLTNGQQVYGYFQNFAHNDGSFAAGNECKVNDVRKRRKGPEYLCHLFSSLAMTIN